MYQSDQVDLIEKGIMSLNSNFDETRKWARKED